MKSQDQAVLEHARAVLAAVNKGLTHSPFGIIQSSRIQLEALPALLATVTTAGGLSELRRDAQLCGALLKNVCDVLHACSTAVSRLHSGYGPTGLIRPLPGRSAISLEI